MKEKAGLIVPVLMMLVGAYAFMSTLGSGAETVSLFGAERIPRGLAMVFGLLGLGGGTAVLLTSLSKHRTAS